MDDGTSDGTKNDAPTGAARPTADLPGGGRGLSAPAYPDEDGSPEPEVTAALTAHRGGALGYRPTLAVVQHGRVLVPVVAVLGEVDFDEQGRARDKNSEMAAVLLTGRDGRTALLGFTSMATMLVWNPQARPVPVPFHQAAASALADGADAVVLDVAGPAPFAVEGDDLRALAEGLVLREVGTTSAREWAWTRSMPTSNKTAT